MSLDDASIKKAFDELDGVSRATLFSPRPCSLLHTPHPAIQLDSRPHTQEHQLGRDGLTGRAGCVD